MIGLIGHHGPRAVMACSVARPRESVRPSFTRSSAAMRSSSHVRFFIAISAMSRSTSAGIRGRPR